MSSGDQLSAYLNALRRRLRLAVLARGGAVLLAVALAATVILVAFSNAFGFSEGSLGGARLALALALACTAIYGLALPWRALDERRAARRAEAAFPQFGERLVTFAERNRGAHDPFLELLAGDTMEVAKVVPPAYLASNGKLLAWMAGATASLAVLVWMVAAGPGFLGYGAARLWAGTRRSAAPYYDIRVSPGDAAVRRSANQLVTAQVIGRQAESARLYARFQSASKWEPVAMQRQPGAAGFEFLFAGLPENVDYYVEAGPLRSRNFKLRVVDLPTVKQIRVTYHFPAWTGLKDAVEEQGGDLRAVEGTEAQLSVLLSQPALHGYLALDDGKQIALAAGGQNSYDGKLRIEKDGLYHVAALDQGQPVRLSTDFFIEARKAKPPEVRITRPAGEYRSSPIEEVTVTVEAQDDFGLKDMALHYSVNGGPEKTTDMLKQKGAKQAEGSATLALEDFKLVPGDVVSLYASARDAHAESHTDMTFIQAEPFSRDFSQSQVSGGGGGGMGGDQHQISQREKEIIAETWKHVTNHESSAQELAEAAKFLSGVQSKLHDQAVSLAGRLEARELTEENEEFSSFQKDMNAAAQAMAPATQALGRQGWKDAMPQEQKALEFLLRAEATFRKIEVAFGSRAGGGGGGSSGRDLQSLFDLELDLEKNQYETEQTAASGGHQSAEIDQALEKLDELARRQEEIAQQPHNTQDFQSRWQQEMLRREAERLQEQMAQMAGKGSQQSASGSSGQSNSGGGQSGADASMRQALERLRQAGDDMRRAAAPQPSAAGADARRAADRLREASQMLQSLRQRDASQQLGSLASDAERLNNEQHEQAERMRRTFEPSEAAKRATGEQSEAAFDELAKLAGDRQRLASDLASLEKQMQDATRGLASGQQSAASKLRDALSGLQQAGLETKLQRSAEMVRRGINPSLGPNETAINSGLERLNEQLRDAQQAMGSGQQNPGEALDRMARLRDQLDTLTRNPADQGGREGRQTGGGGSMHNNAGADAGAAWNGDRYYGGYDPGFKWPQGQPRQPTPTTQADIERAYQQAQRDLNALRQTLRGEPGSLGDIQDLLREISHLDPRRFPGNPAMLEELRGRVLASMDKLELQVRRDVDDKRTGQVRTGDALHVPDGYQEPVAKYFRSLSEKNEGKQDIR